jgi:hypothetical protein
MGFAVDKVALRQIFSEYFGFPRQLSFHRTLHTHHHHHHHLSSGAGTVGQTVADVPSGLSLAPLKKLKKNRTIFINCDRIRHIDMARTGRVTLFQAILCVHSPGKLSNTRNTDSDSPRS